MPKYLVDFEGKKYMSFGNTFSIGIRASKGDIIDVMVQEIWKHVNKEGLMRFSWHKPDVRQKADRTETSTIADCEAIVDAIGFLVKEWEEVMAENPKLQPKEEGRELRIRDFPERMQQNFNQVAESKKWYPFVMQWHFRGKSVHTDLRHYVPAGYLEGFTLFTPRSIELPDLMPKAENIRGTIKLIQPPAWLRFDGISKIGGPGSTKEFPGVFVIVGKGKYTIDEADDHKIVLQYKYDSGSIDKTPLRKAEKMGLPTRDPGDKLFDYSGRWSYHIAHIRPTEWIMLFQKIKVE